MVIAAIKRKKSQRKCDICEIPLPSGFRCVRCGWRTDEAFEGDADDDDFSLSIGLATSRAMIEAIVDGSIVWLLGPRRD
jgi:hypothetical protein